MALNWNCPYCKQYASITNNLMSEKLHMFDMGNKHGPQYLATGVIVCPNGACRESTIRAFLYEAVLDRGQYQPGEIQQEWDLRPQSSAIVFPDYVPGPIREDYEEACAIKTLSPKASATLSRRCLQGMIRDYWGIIRGRLVEEVRALEEKVDPETWQAIDAIRTIGNIGAHMEKDINEIVEVDPDEAQLLIGLIEMLIKDWYVARYKRQQHLKKIVEAAKYKK
ncbi:DUF4145 domain-containing protein [Pseudomonas japonica]|uniref:DUF4145 domain-containing protein n=1 Tax=Pseudomonas japonica TaxID=256466 RepID=UPI0015E48CB9|nr:DUF4145 domain-containing protein [Pseudomonas japonica]MBA1243418.1 DUF4145 domain-containing protein [Pseudomonas japonica]MBA1290533.1 DUF4145 domain-containing protein [Pseudomonas japonica]